jgi:hypothetical protein
MIISNKNLLMPIVKSSGGVHLTAYMRNEYNTAGLKKNIRKLLSTSQVLIAPHLSSKEMNNFLAPIQRLIEDVQYFKKFKSDIGIFLTKDYFKVINVPIGTEELCVISSTFHVKPLLKWMQSDRDFLFLGFGESSVSLYQGNLNSINYIDTVIFPEARKILRDKKESDSWNVLKMKRIISLGAVEWLNDWVQVLTLESRPPLFIAGDKELTGNFIKDVNYENLRKNSIWNSFDESQETGIFSKIKAILGAEIKINDEKNLKEITLAEKMKLTTDNIFQIAKAAILGNVEKLFIADDINIFGIMNRNTGNLVLHSEQKNLFDDDLLDDLAQEVLSHGGEVVLASRKNIPNGSPVLAILHKKTTRFDECLLIESNYRKKEHGLDHL